MNRRTRWALVPTMVTLATCSLVEDTCACTSVAPAVIVAGKAIDSAGAELEGVVVGLRVRNPSCTTSLTPEVSVVTDSLGRYLLYQGGLREGTEVCAEVEGIRFLPSAVDTVQVGGIPLTVGFADPHEVDLTFPHRPTS